MPGIVVTMLEEQEPGTIVVLVDPRDSRAVQAGMIQESIWRDSEFSGWIYRIDSARPEIRQQQHVAVCLKKHQSSKNQQASWNADASRHDRSTFNTKVGAQSKAQAIARRALGLPDDVVLEDAGQEVQATFGVKLLTESSTPSLNTDELLGAVFLIADRR
ncbi:MAG: hypothetical protein J0H49_28860 [Acidobacteria bacterium]|nr:hypothetical protein [Acidobacteriota bacterium]